MGDSLSPAADGEGMQAIGEADDFCVIVCTNRQASAMGAADRSTTGENRQCAFGRRKKQYGVFAIFDGFVLGGAKESGIDAADRNGRKAIAG